MDEKLVPDLQSNNSFHDQGIPPIPPIVNIRFIGRVRPLSTLKKTEIVYGILMVASILTDSSFTIYQLTEISPENPNFKFGFMLLLNAVFCFIYVIDGIWRESPTELVILTLSTISISVFLILNYALESKYEVKLVRLAVACTVCVVLIPLGLMIAKEYHDSKHIIFRVVRHTGLFQTLYYRVRVFQDLLKFDLQLELSMVIFVFTFPDGIDSKDMTIIPVVILTICWFLVGRFSMPRESKIGATIFFLLSLVTPGYVGWEISDVVRYIDSYPGEVYASIVCSGAATVVRIIVTIVAIIIVCRGFGRGLKDRLYPKNEETTEDTEVNSSGTQTTENTAINSSGHFGYNSIN